MNCKLIDSRTKKTYTGKLATNITIGLPIKVLLADGKNEFHILNIKRCMCVGPKYYIIDKNDIRFTLILQ